jgi:hypothetical protein
MSKKRPQREGLVCAGVVWLQRGNGGPAQRPALMPAHRIHWRCSILIVWQNKTDALNGCYAGEDALLDAPGRLWHPDFICAYRSPTVYPVPVIASDFRL